jgi:hypothetical protein
VPMKDKSRLFMSAINQSRAALPVEDYSVAVRKAIQWLGKRYLLAVPVKSRERRAVMPAIRRSHI